MIQSQIYAAERKLEGKEFVKYTHSHTLVGEETEGTHGHHGFDKQVKVCKIVVSFSLTIHLKSDQAQLTVKKHFFSISKSNINDDRK